MRRKIRRNNKALEKSNGVLEEILSQAKMRKSAFLIGQK